MLFTEPNMPSVITLDSIVEGACPEYDPAPYSPGFYKHIHGFSGCVEQLVEDPPTESSASAESPATIQDSTASSQTKRKRKAKDGETTETKDYRLEKTFIYSTNDETAILPRYIQCASCKKAQLLSQFVVSRNQTWVVNKSCMSCCTKGLSHYEKKKRTKKSVPSESITAGINGVMIPKKEEHRWLCDACDPWGSCGRPDCGFIPKRTDLVRKQRSAQGAKRRVPLEFDYLYELEQ